MAFTITFEIEDEEDAENAVERILEHFPRYLEAWKLGYLIYEENPYKLPDGAALDLDGKESKLFRRGGVHYDSSQKHNPVAHVPEKGMPFQAPSKPTSRSGPNSVYGHILDGDKQAYSIVKSLEFGYRNLPRNNRHIVVLFAGEGNERS